MFAIYYTFVSVATGRTVDNHVLICAKSARAARRAFMGTHRTEAGQHKITKVQKFSTVELDTLPL